jgi:hypothetical protein
MISNYKKYFRIGPSRKVSFLPNFLGIGVQKGATSWLWYNLRAHPEVWMPPFKEIHYFDHVYIEENRSWTLYHIKKSVSDALSWYVKSNKINLDYFKYLIDIALIEPFTEKWYYRIFDRLEPASSRAIGEITPEYFMLPKEGILYVRKLLGDIKLIITIRHPVDRAISQIKMNAERKELENLNDDKLWFELAREDVIYQRADYKIYIPRWLSVFKEKSILFIPFGDIKNRPRKVLDSIENHLFISKFERYPSLNDKVYATKSFKVPDTIYSYLQERMHDQIVFLENFFGKDFLINT